MLSITISIYSHILGIATLMVAGILLRSYYIKQSRNRKGYYESIKQNGKDYGSINGNVKDKEFSSDFIKLIITCCTSTLVSNKNNHEDHQTD